jgi:hypothetical protein
MEVRSAHVAVVEMPHQPGIRELRVVVEFEDGSVCSRAHAEMDARFLPPEGLPATVTLEQAAEAQVAYMLERAKRQRGLCDDLHIEFFDDEGRTEVGFVTFAAPRCVLEVEVPSEDLIAIFTGRRDADLAALSMAGRMYPRRSAFARVLTSVRQAFVAAALRGFKNDVSNIKYAKERGKC